MLGSCLPEKIKSKAKEFQPRSCKIERSFQFDCRGKEERGGPTGKSTKSTELCKSIDANLLQNIVNAECGPS